MHLAGGQGKARHALKWPRNAGPRRIIPLCFRGFVAVRCPCFRAPELAPCRDDNIKGVAREEGPHMHDVTTSHWHEPKGFKNAGYGAWKRPNTAYDDFMEAQGIPIYRAIGVRKVQDLPLKPWARMGGQGTFIQLFGTEG